MSRPDTASTLQKAIELLDLQPTYNDFFKNYYIGRETSGVANMIVATILAAKTKRVGAKILFTGHRGSGKTTELHSIKNLLEEQGFLVIFVTATMDLRNNPDVYYTDLFLLLMSKIYKIIESSNMHLDDKLMDNLEDLLNQLAGESDIKMKTKKSSRKISNLSTLFEKFFNVNSLFSMDYNTKVLTRKKADALIGNILVLFNDMISSLEERINKLL